MSYIFMTSDYFMVTRRNLLDIYFKAMCYDDLITSRHQGRTRHILHIVEVIHISNKPQDKSL